MTDEALTASGPAPSGKPTASLEELVRRLRMPRMKHDHPPVKNANEIASNQLSPLDKFALSITDKVGSMGFFIIIFVWTCIWCGYNIVASEITALHLKPFDPFPAFVAYLLISNVIQIMLMPLIMVGQNVQSRHAEVRADLDFQVNQKAEQEIAMLFTHIEHNTELILHLMKHIDCRLTEEELAAIDVHNKEALKIQLDRPKVSEV
jgi:uncharacterized membrane protein